MPPPEGLPAERKLSSASASAATITRTFSKLSDALLGSSPPNSSAVLPQIAVSSAQQPAKPEAQHSPPVQPSTPEGVVGEPTGPASAGRSSASKVQFAAAKTSVVAEAECKADGAAKKMVEAIPFPDFFGLRGAAARSQELCRQFGLPSKEACLDDYNCALRKKVLLQGRIYIFDHHVCFSSSVFGYSKKVVIPLANVTAVRKKTHLRFPNSIKVEVSTPHGAASYFFTSFLSRDDAFQLIDNCWAHSRARRQQQDGSSGELPVSTLDASSAVPDSVAPATNGGGVGLNQRSGTTGGAEDDDDEDEGDAANCTVWSTITAGPVPAPPPDSQVVVQAVLDGTPRDLFDMLLADNSHVLEDFLDSQGNRRMNLSRWKHEATLLGHVRDFQFISPIKGAFSNWGVPHTECLQSHRFRRFEGDHFVFESSQTMTSIPYGDCFTVDMRWDITPLAHTAATGRALSPISTSAAGEAAAVSLSTLTQLEPDLQQQCEVELPPQMHLTIRARVPFSRKCLFRKVIEIGAVRQVKDTYSVLVEQLRGSLAALVRDRQPVQLGPAPAAGSILRLTPSLTASTRQLGSPQRNTLRASDAGAGEALVAASGGAAAPLGVPPMAARGHNPRYASSTWAREGGGLLSQAGPPRWHERLRRSSLAFLARSIIMPMAGGSAPLPDRVGTYALSSDGCSAPATVPVVAGTPGSPAGALSPSKLSRVQSTAGPLATAGSMGGKSATFTSATIAGSSGSSSRGGWLLLLLVALAVLGLQVLVLMATLHLHEHTVSTSGKPGSPFMAWLGGLARQTAASPPTAAADAGGAMDALVVATREMWARRSALLEVELSLIQQHVRAVQEQVKVAHAHTTGAVQ